ncbi:MAG: diaminopimelate epimerase, partial [Candidatus Margulisbacteria bacterium]|nr:diaminopimelate epimerase [Candidatus Margulisiibacteriota bacterium]
MKHTLSFTKMQGLGNDFIIMDGISQRFNDVDLSRLSIRLCDRHFGIGANGLIILEESKQSDFKMSIINSDGSIPEMCGNGIRCLATYIYDNELSRKTVFSVETLAGIIVPGLVIQDGKVV